MVEGRLLFDTSMARLTRERAQMRDTTWDAGLTGSSAGVLTMWLAVACSGNG